jgi:hypothetical protein
LRANAFEELSSTANDDLLVRRARYHNDRADVVHVPSRSWGDFINLDGEVMGHLLACQSKRLFPDEFRDEERLGLIGPHGRWKVLRSFWEQWDEQLKEPIDVHLRGRGDRQDRLHRSERRDTANNSVNLCRVTSIRLADGDNYGPRGRVQQGMHLVVVPVDPPGSIDDPYADVTVCHGPRGRREHLRPELVAWLVHCWSIRDNQLGLGQREDAVHPAAGRQGHRARDRDFRADKLVN